MYNHTNEADDRYPYTTSFRGIDNKVSDIILCWAMTFFVMVALNLLVLLILETCFVLLLVCFGFSGLLHGGRRWQVDELFWLW